MPKQTECDLTAYDELITDLITLRLILKDTEKNKKDLKFEIKNKLTELEQNKNNELKLL